MQKPNARKRRQILDAAAALFSSRPFHEVHLDNVAAKAKVGKGTLYVYFKSKEDLYVTLIREGFAEMTQRAKEGIEAEKTTDVWKRLRVIVREHICFGTRYPDLFRVMRNQALTPDDAGIQTTRDELVGLIREVLRDGVKRRQLRDPHPEITVQFILGFVRNALLYPPKGMTPTTLEAHALYVLHRGVGARRTG